MVISPIHDTHPSLADLLDDFVVGESFANHVSPSCEMQLRSMLRLEGVKGNGKG